MSAKTDKFYYTRTSRTYLMAVDFTPHSKHAMEWVLNKLVLNYDEVVAVHVMPDESSVTDETARQHANKLLEIMMDINKKRGSELSFRVEAAVGDVQEIIDHMIDVYTPDCLIAGTRDDSSHYGSVSKHLVAHSPVPVITVRPDIAAS